MFLFQASICFNLCLTSKRSNIKVVPYIIYSLISLAVSSKHAEGEVKKRHWCLGLLEINIYYHFGSEIHLRRKCWSKVHHILPSDCSVSQIHTWLVNGIVFVQYNSFGKLFKTNFFSHPHPVPRRLMSPEGSSSP